MSTSFRRHFVLALLLLVACDSSTDPNGGDSGFGLADAFDDGIAEFEDDITSGRLRFDGIDFGGRSSVTLTDDDKAILDRFAAVFAGLPGARYAIESHTDERGAEASNLALTLDRAEAVRDYLVDVVGGPAPYITWDGLGESVPLDEESNAAAWARNDRIEIMVTYPDGPVMRFVLEARRLDVVLDCDAESEPGVLQPGDFWVTVSIRVSNSDGFFVMDEVVDEGVSANDGETIALAIAASAAILPVETDIVEIYVEFEEFDGSGTFDFRRSQLFQLGYVPELDCWGRWGEDVCGSTDAGIIVVENGSTGGPPCEASLEWALRLEQIR